MELSSLHLGIFLITLIFIVRADHEGFSYVRGKRAVLDANRVIFYHRIIWVGLVLMITTGVLLMRPAWEFYIADPIFIAKMVFVLGLVVNGFFIGALSRIATKKPFVALTTRERVPLFISGAISVVAWIGSFSIGFFFL
jgi:hypothetical protein